MPRKSPLTAVFVFALLAAVLVAGPCAAGKDDKVPTKINSDSMRVEDDGRRVVFTGNVTVDRVDMNITSETLTIYLPPSKGGQDAALGGQASEIEKIVARGSVRLVREGRVGTCAKATWYEKKGLLVMEGDPRLTEDKNVVRGEIIKLWVRENRSEVVGGKSRRVEAIFFTPKQSGPKPGSQAAPSTETENQ